MSERLILIDGENCLCDRVFGEITKAKNSDIWIIAGSKMRIQRKYSDKSQRVVKAKTDGKNALDFVLLSEAIKALYSKKYKEVVIVSDDKGYDAAIMNLTAEGFSIRRQKTKQKVLELFIPEEADTQKFKQVAGFISNSFEAGVNNNIVIREMQKHWEQPFVQKYVGLLLALKYAYISKDGGFYFDKQQLRSLANNTLQIGEKYKRTGAR